MRDQRLEHGPAPIPVNFVAGRPVEGKRLSTYSGRKAYHLFFSPFPSAPKPVGVRYQSRPWPSTSSRARAARAGRLVDEALRRRFDAVAPRASIPRGGIDATQ